MRKFWIIRHCERLDSVDPSWIQTTKYPEDTPLSSRGLQQAEDLGELFVKQPIDHILSSPFTRAIQTATPIARKLGKKIKVEIGLHEWCHHGIPEIADILDKSWIDHDYESLWPSVLVENKQEVMHRMRVMVEALRENLDGNLILISHGTPVELLVSVMINRSVPMPNVGEIYEVEFGQNQWNLK